MKERPILFSSPMVRAILDGRKTQTRRVVKPQPSTQLLGRVGTQFVFAPTDHDGGQLDCPYGVPGDRLWVRETCMPFTDGRGENKALYKATGDVASGSWHPSIHMPRWASRITLEITDVRVQRVQEIDWRDAEAEGIDPQGGNSSDGEWRRVEAYKNLWDSINGKTHPWANNDWVWAVSFRRAA